MLATIVHRGLTVWLDPVARSARVQVHMLGRPDIHVVLVQPRDGGWVMVDDREDEPVWFGAFEQALSEALACGSMALEDRLLGELRSGERQPRPPLVEVFPEQRPVPPWPSGLP